MQIRLLYAKSRIVKPDLYTIPKLKLILAILGARLIQVCSEHVINQNFATNFVVGFQSCSQLDHLYQFKGSIHL